MRSEEKGPWTIIEVTAMGLRPGLALGHSGHLPRSLPGGLPGGCIRNGLWEAFLEVREEMQRSQPSLASWEAARPGCGLPRVGWRQASSLKSACPSCRRNPEHPGGLCTQLSWHWSCVCPAHVAGGAWGGSKREVLIYLIASASWRRLAGRASSANRPGGAGVTEQVARLDCVWPWGSSR